MSKEKRPVELARDCIVSLENNAAQFGAIVLSYKESLHQNGYWETLSRIKNMMEQTEKIRAELNIIAQTLGDAKDG